MSNILRWSPAELAAYQKRLEMRLGAEALPRAKPRESVNSLFADILKAPAKTNVPPGPFRSHLEAEYADILEQREWAGEIKDWGYERIKLRLPGDVWYCPDFDILEIDGSVSIIEIKGWMREVARNKLRAAVDLYPGFTWFIAGINKTPVRMFTSADVPSARKVVR